MSIDSKKYFESTSGEVKTFGKNGSVIVEVGENITFTDYIELLFSVAGGNVAIYEDAQDAFWHRKDLVEIAEEWEWEDFMNSVDGGDIADVWVEAEWFQDQMNTAFHFENGYDFSDWKEIADECVLVDGFGEW